MSNGPRVSNILVSYLDVVIGTAEMEVDGTLTMKIHSDLVSEIRQNLLFGNIGSLELNPKYIPAILPDSAKTRHIPQPRDPEEEK
jgi:hypothetical protein